MLRKKQRVRVPPSPGGWVGEFLILPFVVIHLISLGNDVIICNCVEEFFLKKKCVLVFHGLYNKHTQCPINPQICGKFHNCHN